MKQSASALSRPQVTTDNENVPHTTQLTPQPKNPRKTFNEVAVVDIAPSLLLIRPAEDLDLCNTYGHSAHSKPNLEEII